MTHILFIQPVQPVLSFHHRTWDRVRACFTPQASPDRCSEELCATLQAAILTGRRSKTALTLKEVDDSVDRIVAGMEGTPMVDSKSKSLVAYHEVGHAVCATLTPGIAMNGLSVQKPNLPMLIHQTLFLPQLVPLWLLKKVSPMHHGAQLQLLQATLALLSADSPAIIRK